MAAVWKLSEVAGVSAALMGGGGEGVGRWCQMFYCLAREALDMVQVVFNF
jgi:hypothetical protein